MHAAGAPEHLIVILEGESLFNDATSIVLFQIFFKAVQNLRNKQAAFRGSVLRQALTISEKIVVLAAGQSPSLTQSAIALLGLAAPCCIGCRELGMHDPITCNLNETGAHLQYKRWIA